LLLVKVQLLLAYTHTWGCASKSHNYAIAARSMNDFCYSTPWIALRKTHCGLLESK